MASLFETVYTSAAETFDGPGYGVVARTRGLPTGLERVLRSSCRYDFDLADAARHAQGRFPTVYAHVVHRGDGRDWHILSRVGFAGDDYSGRAVFLAHQIAVAADALTGRPTDLMRAPGLFRETWDGAPTQLDPRPLPRATSPAGPTTWARLTGHRDWARAWAARREEDRGAPAFLIVPEQTDVLALFAEAASLLDPESARTLQFITMLAADRSGQHFDWVGLPAGSDLAATVVARNPSRTLDLTRPLAAPPPAPPPPPPPGRTGPPRAPNPAKVSTATRQRSDAYDLAPGREARGPLTEDRRVRRSTPPEPGPPPIVRRGISLDPWTAALAGIALLALGAAGAVGLSYLRSPALPRPAEPPGIAAANPDQPASNSLEPGKTALITGGAGDTATRPGPDPGPAAPAVGPATPDPGARPSAVPGDVPVAPGVRPEPGGVLPRVPTLGSAAAAAASLPVVEARVRDWLPALTKDQLDRAVEVCTIDVPAPSDLKLKLVYDEKKLGLKFRPTPTLPGQRGVAAEVRLADADPPVTLRLAGKRLELVVPSGLKAPTGTPALLDRLAFTVLEIGLGDELIVGRVRFVPELPALRISDAGGTRTPGETSAPVRQFFLTMTKLDLARSDASALQAHGLGLELGPDARARGWTWPLTAAAPAGGTVPEDVTIVESLPRWPRLTFSANFDRDEKPEDPPAKVAIADAPPAPASPDARPAAPARDDTAGKGPGPGQAGPDREPSADATGDEPADPNAPLGGKPARRPTSRTKVTPRNKKGATGANAAAPAPPADEPKEAAPAPDALAAELTDAVFLRELFLRYGRVHASVVVDLGDGVKRPILTFGQAPPPPPPAR